MSGVNFFSYFVPFCTKHHAAKDFLKLNCKQQWLVVFATLGGTLASAPILGTGGIATFRKIVKEFKNKNAKKANKVFQETKQPSVKKPIAISHEDFIARVIEKITLQDNADIPAVKDALEAAFNEDFATTKEFQAKLAQLKIELADKIDDITFGHIHGVVGSVFAAMFANSKPADGDSKTKMPKINNPDTTALGHLADVCSEIQNKTKRAMYIQAVNLFDEFKCKDEIQELYFEDNSAYNLSHKSSPKYLNDVFKSKGVRVGGTDGYYTYKKDEDPSVYEYHVDFANRFLGGHIDESYAQEEKMIAEMANFMNYIAGTLDHKTGMSTVRVRDGGASVGKGTPNPRIYENCIRVQELGGYGSIPSFDNFAEIARPLDAPQTVNVLAMAAPQLGSTSLKTQLGRKTAEDLFNTFHAGFSLVAANQKPGKTPLVHTGKIGCGVFNNNPTLVFLLQRLAAEQIGVGVIFHGYEEEEYIAADEIWGDIQKTLEGKTLDECLDIIIGAVKDAAQAEKTETESETESEYETDTDTENEPEIDEKVNEAVSFLQNLDASQVGNVDLGISVSGINLPNNPREVVSKED